MAEPKTKPTQVSVRDFIANVSNETRRKDAEVLLKLFKKVTGAKPRMWGPTIVGFGSIAYLRDRSCRYDAGCRLFSPIGQPRHL